jgi:hypothetical protein
MSEHYELDSDTASAEDSGGFVALAVLAEPERLCCWLPTKDRAPASG